MKTALDKSINRLTKLNPCSEAVLWIESVRNGATTAQEIWDECERGDWMLWLCGKLSGGARSSKRKLLVKTACACARLSLKWCNDKRPLQCIETAEAWTDGNASLKDVRFAADAADAAAAASAYAAAADVDARKNTLKSCSDIIRRFYPKCPL